MKSTKWLRLLKSSLREEDNRKRREVDGSVADILCRLLRCFKITDRTRAIEAEINRRNSEKVLGEGLIQPVSFLMFNRDFEPMSSHMGFPKGHFLPRDSKTNDRASGFTMPLPPRFRVGH